MKKIILILLLVTQLVFCQEKPNVATYNFGHNGMEFIAKSKSGMIIISTFNSKMTIREDIASKVYNMYLENKIKTNNRITVNGKEANVTGKCIVRKKNNLTVVDFYYEKVLWNSGLLEIYKKNFG